MTKGLIFDLLRMKNGIFITILRLIRIGIAKDNGEKFITFLIAVYKFETTISFTWRELYGNQKNKKTSEQESETSVASA